MRQWLLGLFVRRFDMPGGSVVDMKIIHMSQQILGMTPNGPDPMPDYTLKMLAQDLKDETLEVDFRRVVAVSGADPFGTLRSRAVNFIASHLKSSEVVMQRLTDAETGRRVIKRKVGV